MIKEQTAIFTAMAAFSLQYHADARDRCQMPTQPPVANTGVG